MLTTRFAWLALAALIAGFAACGGETDATTACEPGEPIFCKCPGTALEGNKVCKDDGETFEECITPDGPCSELEPTTTGTGGGPAQTDCRPGLQIACRCENGDDGMQTCNEDGDGFDECATEDGPCGSGETTTVGAGGGGAGEPLFIPCGSNGECASGVCAMGFCTRECGSIEDCADGVVEGTCARFEGGTVQVCAPFCSVLQECEEAYGEPSACGYGVDPSNPGLYFTVCGDWLGELSPLPQGFPCEVDLDCSLGIVGAERVCTFEECIVGCYVDDDCPGSELCDSEGNYPGSCF